MTKLLVCLPFVLVVLALGAGCGETPAAAADAVVDGAVGQVADAATGDAAEVDVALVDGADAKNCPPGTQIKGCPCVKPPWHEDYGCCLAIGAGLSCEGPKGAELWYEIGDCCTEEEPHCGSTKPSSGFAPLCLSKPLP